MDNKKLKDLFSKDNKNFKSNIFTVFAIGVLLIIVGNTFFTGESTSKSPPKSTEGVDVSSEASKHNETEIERRLENILSSVAGAGQIKVMVTMTHSGEVEVAQDVSKDDTSTTETTTQGDKRQIDSSKYENKTVLLENNDGSSKPLIIKETEPKIEGIVIVAQGGDNILVKDSLSKAVQALLNVPAHKVEVLKMK